MPTFPRRRPGPVREGTLLAEGRWGLLEFARGEEPMKRIRLTSANRLPGLVAELISLKVDPMFAPSTPSARAAKNATSIIPIVFASAANPVGDGHVARTR